MLNFIAMHFDDIPFKQLASSYDTPLYIYDAERIKQQYHSLLSAFDVPSVRINYAVKALSNLSILKLFKDLGAGLDTVSVQEIRLGLLAGFIPSDIVYTPNSVSFDEIEVAIELGVRINIDNLDYLERIGHEYSHLPICIRFNPHVMAGGNSKISVGHIDSKFGISIHQLPLVERLVKTLGVNVEGVHMHTGSDILDVDVFMRAADILFGVAKNFEDLRYIDFGSGFKVKYKEGDIETDIKSFGEEMSLRFNSFLKETGLDCELMFEPGKFLVSESGYFMVTANLIKQTTSTVFACVDSGFNHFIRPMFYDAYHDIVNVSNPDGKPKIYSVVGYICETDTFAWNRRISEISAGDLLVFKNAGAYCYAMASNYNSRYRPAEVLLINGESHLIRERETIDDIVGKQIALPMNIEIT